MDAIGRPREGFEYSRTGNPTRQALEEAWPRSKAGRTDSRSRRAWAATTAVLNLLRPGDHVVAGDDLYGGTFRLLDKVYRPWGLRVDYADSTKPESFAAAITPQDASDSGSRRRPTPS
jgi:cystathionine beta-lyase/cystathionine gamma-synthase